METLPMDIDMIDTGFPDSMHRSLNLIKTVLI